MSQVDPFQIVELNALSIARARLLDLPNGDELAEAVDQGSATVDLEPASADEISIVVIDHQSGTKTLLATVTNATLTYNPSQEEWKEALAAKTLHFISCRPDSAELQEQIRRGERRVQSHTFHAMTSLFITGGEKPIWLGDLHRLDVLRPMVLDV